MSADPQARLRAALDASPDDAAGRTARAAELLALQQSRAIVAVADQLAAAVILVGGSSRAELEAAQALALAAAPKSPAARPLVARAFDRLRQLAGQPQKYGTLADWPVDPHTTDAERSKWGVPPLGQLGRDHRTP
jgi:hypothetical protein